MLCLILSNTKLQQRKQRQDKVNKNNNIIDSIFKFIVNEKTGLLIQSKDVNALTKAIEKVMISRQLCFKIGINTYSLFKRNLNYNYYCLETY